MTQVITEEVARKVLQVVDKGLVKGVGEPIPGEMCVEAAVCYALGEKHGDAPTCVSPALRAFKIGLNDANWSSNTIRAKGMRRIALAQLGSAGELDEIEFTKRLAMLTVTKILPRALRLCNLENEAKICEAAINLTAAARAADAAADAAAAYAVADAAHAVADAVADAAAYAARAAAYAVADAVVDAAAYAARAAAYADAYAAARSAAARSAADAAAHAAADAADAAARAADAAAADEELSVIAEEVVQILIEMNAPGYKWLFLAPKIDLS